MNDAMISQMWENGVLEHVFIQFKVTRESTCEMLSFRKSVNITAVLNDSWYSCVSIRFFRVSYLQCSKLLQNNQGRLSYLFPSCTFRWRSWMVKHWINIWTKRDFYTMPAFTNIRDLILLIIDRLYIFFQDQCNQILNWSL